MKKNAVWMLILILAVSHLAMGRNSGQYDEEAREQEREEKAAQKDVEKEPNHPVQNFASGIKQATYDNTKDVLEETAEGTKEEPPVIGTLEGARRSTGKVLDNTVKGAVKVATLGYVKTDHYEVEEPKKGSDETTKVKFSF